MVWPAHVRAGFIAGTVAAFGVAYYCVIIPNARDRPSLHPNVQAEKDLATKRK
jgi:hypothetical protein